MVPFAVRIVRNTNRSKCEMKQIKINGLVFERIGVTSDGRPHYYNVTHRVTIHVNDEDLNSLGATLVKEPRRATVWEWRKYPGVPFIPDGCARAHMWMNGMLLDGKNTIYTCESLLESEGVEVIE